jgi:hypothetical protein
MRLLACLFLLLGCGLPGRASAGMPTRAPLEDVGMPFCDRGYDRDERCCTDTKERELDFEPAATASASFGLPAYRARLVVSYSLPATGVVP